MLSDLNKVVLETILFFFYKEATLFIKAGSMHCPFMIVLQGLTDIYCASISKQSKESEVIL